MFTPRQTRPNHETIAMAHQTTTTTTTTTTKVMRPPHRNIKMMKGPSPRRTSPPNPPPRRDHRSTPAPRSNNTTEPKHATRQDSSLFSLAHLSFLRLSWPSWRLSQSVPIVAVGKKGNNFIYWKQKIKKTTQKIRAQSSPYFSPGSSWTCCIPLNKTGRTSFHFLHDGGDGDCNDSDGGVNSRRTW